MEKEAPEDDAVDVGATFTCGLCCGPAGTVQVIRPGRPTPIPPHIQGVPPGVERMFIESYRVVVRELGSFTLLGDEGEARALAFEDVLRRRDVEALCELERDAAFFWCRQCRLVLCPRHWTRDTARTTSDNLWAVCPSGHTRHVWGD